ncbi:MAG: peptidoglycan DD-metalloendopeptidase family protein [candidate division Zixibacteria bacterium]|nr:peptidoglycan DD-metalloendopeptidase family protein [candidate division Zixibacteria bacterium]
MGKRRHINVVIAPEDRSGTLTFRLQLGHFYALVIVASVLFILVAALVVNQAMDEAKLGELKLLRRQNVQLKEEVKRVAAVERKIAELEVVEDKLMVMAGEREAARELAPVSIEGEEGTREPVSVAEGIRQFRELVASRRGVALKAPDGNPVEKGWVTRGFAENAGLEGYSFHNGVDIACPEGTPVSSTAPGVVTFAGEDPVYGRLVIIQHGLTGYSTFYGHNRELKVRAGRKVGRGDIVAAAGNTGRSSAPHLHYEVRLHGVPVNPAKYMKPAETGPGEQLPPPPLEEEKPAQKPKPTGVESEGGIPTGDEATGSEGPPAPPALR